MHRTLRDKLSRVVAVASALGLVGFMAFSPQSVRATTDYIVVGPAGCGDVGYVTDGTADDVQIQAALEDVSDGGTVELCEATFEYAADVDVDASIGLTIIGAGAADSVLDGNSAWNLLVLDGSDVDLTIRGVGFEDADAGFGSAILMRDNGGTSSGSKLTIYDSAFMSNYNSGDGGGAIQTEDVDVRIYDSQFEDNDADGDNGAGGGAIRVRRGSILVDGSSFERNSSNENGGAIQTVGLPGKMTVIRSTFIDNESDDNDGGALSSNGPLLVVGSMFEGNASQEDDGGAIYAYGQASIRGSTFLDNFADEEGGAINADMCNGQLVVAGNRFAGNAAEDGGGVNVGDDCEDEYQNPKVTFVRNTFADNVISDSGGAVDIDHDYTKDVVFRSNKFLRNINTGNEGGAIWVFYARLLGNQFVGNSASCGGGVYVARSLFGTAKFNGFRGNSASDGARFKNVAESCAEVG